MIELADARSRAVYAQVVANFDESVMQWALDRTLPMEDGAE